MTGRAVGAIESENGWRRVKIGMALLAIVGMGMVFAFEASDTSEAAPANKKALAKCKKIKKKPARLACTNQVKQRSLQPVKVNLIDDWFVPDQITVRSGRRITWDWGTTNGNSHNVMLDPLSPQPKTLTSADFFRLDSGRSPAINFRFTRDLTKTGTYNFYCSLHSTQMRLRVDVKP